MASIKEVSAAYYTFRKITSPLLHHSELSFSGPAVAVLRTNSNDVICPLCFFLNGPSSKPVSKSVEHRLNTIVTIAVMVRVVSLNRHPNRFVDIFIMKSTK